MGRVEELKALVDQLTPDKRGQFCPYWHLDWQKLHGDELPAARVKETADTRGAVAISGRVREIKAMLL
jgi:hypothetical protein